MERRQTYLNYIDENFCVKLPFILNEQQIEVLREIDRFVHDPFDRVMTISGWAGTGKTTLMEIVKGRYWSTGPNIHFAATTHKAAAVLKTKVNKKVSTVNSLFGIMIEVDMDNDSFDVSKKKRNYDTEKLQTGSLVIIDEASMLSEENYKDVIKKCTDYNCKVIFIGDSAQLAPVNEDDISIVFRDDGVESKHVIELTKVERTDDVPILDEATRIRLEGHLSYKTNINEQGGVQYITNAEQLNQAIDSYVGGLTNNPNYFRILTYTNKNVESLNTIIRRKLGYGKLPEPGEPLMSYANWKYIGKNTYAFINSESYKVISIDNKMVTQIQTYNLRGKLNKASKRTKPKTIIPIAKLPTRIISIEFKPNSNNTVELYLDEGWQFSFRIHNASTLVETSLKFDIQIIGMPTSIISIECSWNRK